jgi:hypothetical protein
MSLREAMVELASDVCVFRDICRVEWRPRERCRWCEMRLRRVEAGLGVGGPQLGVSAHREMVR